MHHDLPDYVSRRRRFLVGAGAGAALLGLPALLRHGRADAPSRFALGIASGHPRPDGMVLWTRLVGDDLPERVEVAWELADDEGFARVVARGSETAVAADAHSVHAEPAGLAPDRWYWYRFRALGQQSTAGRTRTAPAPEAAATLRFAIASCQRWDHGHYAAWRDVAAQPLDLVLFLGDYIYEYPWLPGRIRAHEGGLVATLAGYRSRYAQYKSDPLLQAAHAALPWAMVWDDHEVENDYAGHTGAAITFGFAAQRAAAYRAYWEHMPFPKAARPVDDAMRIHGRLDWGRLARIHLLDDRQYRDPQACRQPWHNGGATLRPSECPQLLDPARSLLGAAQERWLAEGWDTQRPWNLVAQQTLMARAARFDADGQPSYWTDGWDGYAPARRRLLGGVRERKLPGVVVLGGDVHAHYVADLKPDYDDEDSPVVASEFCGTSISSQGAPQGRVDTLRSLNPHLRYARSDKRGYVAFRLDERGLDAQLRAVERSDDPASPVSTIARFRVEAGRPGPQPA